MDTRFWGPSGWRLLHLITFAYEPTKQNKAVQTLFENLPYVLPCKFCRASLTEYMHIEPLEPALASKAKLTRWLYTIHNHVNEKLRKQGLLQESNPSFAAVKKMYEERLLQGCTQTSFEGWDFLFSIAENHPMSIHGSTPMPNAPPEEKVTTAEERNRWNYMKAAERIPYYTRFWFALEGSLPFVEWRSAWSSCGIHVRANAKRMKKELWRIRCCLEKKLELLNQESYEGLCRKLQEHKSGCNTTRKAKTCRAKSKTYKRKN